jgi:hypothetical protein
MRARVVKVFCSIAWFFFWLAFVPYLVFINDFRTGDLYFNVSTLAGALVCLDSFYVYCFYTYLKSTNNVLQRSGPLK